MIIMVVPINVPQPRAQDIVLESIKKGNDNTTKINKDTGLPPSKIRDALMRLRRWKDVERDEKGNYKVWC